MRRVSQNSCQQRAKRRYNSKNKFVFPHKYFPDEATIRDTQFVYNFPPDWTSINSTKKSISFRTARTIQKFVASFAINVHIEYYFIMGIDDDGDEIHSNHGVNITASATVTEYNTMPDIVESIVQQIQQGIAADTDLAGKIAIYYNIGIEDNGGKSVTIVMNDTSGSLTFVVDEIYLEACEDDSSPFYMEQWTSFLNYFNLSTTLAAIDLDANSDKSQYTLKFSNVWNFQDLYFHADFASGSEHCLLARNDDFYQHPIKYPYTNNTGLFSIWVSFDGKTPAVINNPNFVVELDFIADADDNYND